MHLNFTHTFNELRLSLRSMSSNLGGILGTRSTDTQFQTDCYNYYNSQGSVPKEYIIENGNIYFDTDLALEKACEIIKHIKTSKNSGGDQSAQVHRLMKDNKGSVSSDYSTMFINFCILNNIKIREWNVSDKINGNLSHVFNEIYCSEYDKWIMIDVSETLYFIDTRKKFPLSATEYIDMLSSNQQHKILAVNILTSKEDDELKQNERVQQLYFTSTNLFCLVVNFKPTAAIVPLLKKVLPVAIVQVLLMLAGLSTKYILYVNPHR